MNDDIEQINARLVEFCFQHGTPLLQFAKCIGTCADVNRIVAVQCNPPMLATGDAWSWARRC